MPLPDPCLAEKHTAATGRRHCIVALLLALFLMMLDCGYGGGMERKRPNILFIAVDDLRPELGCYGKQHVVSPEIDGLAREGVVFQRAYCMVPVCGASRATLMAGVRPTRETFRHYRSRADQDAPDAVPLNTHFTRHGYHALSLGKVYHVVEDHAQGWSEPPWRPTHPAGSYCDCYVLPESLETARRHMEESPRGPGQRHRGPAWEMADVADNAYSDGMTTDRAIEDMRRLAAHDAPFFLAVGYIRPHLPFIAPQRYWDLYLPEKISLPENYRPPKNAPRQALHQWSELRAYHGIPQKGPLPDDMAKTLIRGYYASVSYVDALIGRLLREIDELGLTDNTIVVLWGDHGWQLGEHGMWCKHSCFETSMHAPLIMRAPGNLGGAQIPDLVEFIDIYPTLCDLAGLPLPPHLEGRSLKPLLTGKTDAASDGPALGRYGRGDTIRTDQHRYTEYLNNDGKVVARMLYDHHADPHETVNIAEKPENSALVKELSRRLGANGTTDQ